MDWIKRLSVEEARAEMRKLWRQREEAVGSSEYDEVERLNMILAAVAGRIGELGGDVG
ncbi:hypothetical protein [Azospirillum brasilense]|uniref:hypothetical protein n=1 Tax=Azospirillum brasilense TaxID=192 RepID=UPI00157B7821|nr:hypothetical protein [Azospirillum brasilense]